MALLTLFGYTPPARFGADEIAWTQARIEDSSTETGSYVEVETVPLEPVDQDPSDPATRNLTTHDATVGNWYRVVWVDDDAFESGATVPVQFVDSSLVPVYGTRAELARRLKVVESGNEDALDRVLLIASGEITNQIGRTDLAGWEVALATEVALERAGEHWHQLTSPVGFIGLGIDASPFIAARDTWERSAYKLAPLIDQWGIA
jgi:hypothetical protein